MPVPPIVTASALATALPAAISVPREVVNQFGKLLQQLSGNSPSSSSQAKENNNLSASAASSKSSLNRDSLLSVLQKQTSQLQQTIDKEIREALNKNGIPVNQVINFNLDSYGRIQVVGEHPQKEVIEKSLVTRPELKEQMERLSGLTTLMQASQKEGQATSANSSNQQPGFQFKLTPR